MSRKPSGSFSIAELRKELLRELRDKAIPWAGNDGVKNLVLAELPLRVPAGTPAWHYPMKPLYPPKGSEPGDLKMMWSASRMKAIRDPFMGIVIEGEADFRVAVKPPPAARPLRNAPQACQAITLRQGSFFLVPSGAPHDDRVSHWFRPHKERAASRILWIRAPPTGVLCQICTTRGTLHEHRPYLFIRDLYLRTLFHLLIEEMSERLPGAEFAGAGILMAMLARTVHGLAGKEVHQTHGSRKKSFSFGPEPDAAIEMGSVAVERACRFIQAHLGHRLSPAIVASRVFISPSYLNSLFQQEHSMSIMRYVAHRRIETAKELLADTGLEVTVIAQTVGYPVLTSFTHAFLASTGVSPTAYRKRHFRLP